MTTPSETFFSEAVTDFVRDQYADQFEALRAAGYTNIEIEPYPDGFDWLGSNLQPLKFPDNGAFIVTAERNGARTEVADGGFLVDKQLLGSGTTTTVEAIPTDISLDLGVDLDEPDTKWAVVESFVHSEADEEWDDDDEQLCWVRLAVAGGPYDTRAEAEDAASVTEDEYRVISLPPR